MWSNAFSFCHFVAEGAVTQSNRCGGLTERCGAFRGVAPVLKHLSKRIESSAAGLVVGKKNKQTLDAELGFIDRMSMGGVDGLADWLKIHGEAVYGPRPWKTHGVGGQTRKGHFTERTRYDSEPWGSDVIRFTRSKDNKALYVFIYGAKPGEALTIEPLRKGGLLDSKIEAVSLVGSDKKMDFEISGEGLKTTLPVDLVSPIAGVLKIQTAGL